MCKHILNAQVSVRAPCCKKWFDCIQCHDEASSDGHHLIKSNEVTFICKKCKKAFRKDTSDHGFDESDEYCPHCDNHYIIEAKIPHAAIGVEAEDARIDNRIIKDERIKLDSTKSIFSRDKDPSYKLC